MTDFDWQWFPARQAPQGTFVLAHGMAEHHGRYADFARFLAEKGWHVLTFDHPGHGRQASRLGSLGKSGWAAITDRLTVMLAHASEQAPQLPLWVLGHSMGSFAVLNHAATMPLPSNCRGLVLVGSDSPVSGAAFALNRLTALLCRRYGEDHVSKLVDRLTFTQFNRAFRPEKTRFDWICSDSEVVREYVADPLCGFDCSVGLWNELSAVLLRLSRNSTLQQLPENLQILVLAGGRDPVGRFGKGPVALTKRLREQGPGAELKLYPSLRHEILNEKDKAIVWGDIEKMVADFSAVPA